MSKEAATTLMEEEKQPVWPLVFIVFFSIISGIILLSSGSELDLGEWLAFLAFAALGPLILIIILVRQISQFSDWFRSKEIEEINAVDAKIAAVAQALTYEQDVKDQFSTFYYLALAPRAKPQSHHSLSFSTGTAEVQIFDQFYVGSKLRFIGTWIKLKRTKLPNFDILKSEISSAVYPFDTMEQINPHPDLDWLGSGLKLLKPSTQATAEIERLLFQSQQLAPTLSQNDFHLLTKRGENLCLYTTGRLMTSAEQIVELKERAIELVNIFNLVGNEADNLVDLEELKRSEQEQNRDG